MLNHLSGAQIKYKMPKSPISCQNTFLVQKSTTGCPNHLSGAQITYQVRKTTIRCRITYQVRKSTIRCHITYQVCKSTNGVHIIYQVPHHLSDAQINYRVPKLPPKYANHLSGAKSPIRYSNHLSNLLSGAKSPYQVRKSPIRCAYQMPDAQIAYQVRAQSNCRMHNSTKRCANQVSGGKINNWVHKLMSNNL